MIKWFKKNRNIIFTNLIVTFSVTAIFAIAKSLLRPVKLSEVSAFILRILNYEINIPIFYFFLILFILIVVFLLYKNYLKFLINKRRFKVLKATYGSDEKNIDITDELNKAVIENRLKIVLDNNIAGDPHRGVRKGGKVRYKFNGEESEEDYTEGEVIDLPK